MAIIKLYNDQTDQWEPIATGARGPAGPGVANGGVTDQILVKSSNTDFDTEWSSDLVLNTVSVGITKQQTNTAVLDIQTADIEDLQVESGVEDLETEVDDEDLQTDFGSVILSQWDATEYSSSKAVITAISGGERQISEFLLTHNGSNAFITEYGVVATGSTLYTLDAVLDGNTIIIEAMATSNVNVDIVFSIHETLFVIQDELTVDIGNTDLQTEDGTIDLQSTFGSEDLNFFALGELDLQTSNGSIDLQSNLGSNDLNSE